MQVWIVLTSMENLWQRPNFLPYGHGKIGGRDESRLSRINRVRILLIFKTVKYYRLYTQRWEILTIWEIYTNYL